MLMAKSRHRSLQTLQRYVRPGPEAVTAMTAPPRSCDEVPAGIGTLTYFTGMRHYACVTSSLPLR
jgi:hypothetical protein